MSLVERTLWYLESHLHDPLTLSDIAGRMAVTPVHLARVFQNCTGVPVMRYVRRRRLSLAAGQLARADDTVLMVALDAGYASHEAFTRAFRSEFGLTPALIRARADLSDLTLFDAMEWDMTKEIKINPPKIEAWPERVFVGQQRRFTMQTRSEIPGFWAQNQVLHNPDIENQIPESAFGIVNDHGDNGDFAYTIAVEVRRAGAYPNGMVVERTPAQDYAIFATNGHISTMAQMISGAFGWVAESEMQVTGAPMIEHYPATFDGQTGEGGFEICIGVAPRD